MEKRHDDQFHLEISRELGTISARLKNIEKDTSKINEHLAVLNGRVGKNENKLTQLKTQVGFIATIASIIVSAVVAVIIKHI